MRDETPEATESSDSDGSDDDSGYATEDSYGGDSSDSTSSSEDDSSSGDDSSDEDASSKFHDENDDGRSTTLSTENTTRTSANDANIVSKRYSGKKFRENDGEEWVMFGADTQKTIDPVSLQWVAVNPGEDPGEKYKPLQGFDRKSSNKKSFGLNAEKLSSEKSRNSKGEKKKKKKSKSSGSKTDSKKSKKRSKKSDTEGDESSESQNKSRCSAKKKKRSSNTTKKKPGTRKSGASNLDAFSEGAAQSQFSQIVPLHVVSDLFAEILLKSGMWLELMKSLLSHSLAVYGNNVSEHEVEYIWKHLVIHSKYGNGFLPYSDIYVVIDKLGRTAMSFDYFIATFHALHFNFPLRDLHEVWCHVDVDHSHQLSSEQFEGAMLIVLKHKFPKKIMYELQLQPIQIMQKITMLVFIMLGVFFFILISLTSFGSGVEVLAGLQSGFAAGVTIALERLTYKSLDINRYNQAVCRIIKRHSNYNV